MTSLSQIVAGAPLSGMSSRILLLSSPPPSLPARRSPKDDTIEVPKRKQLVIVSFDGAHDKLWEKSRAMAKRTGAHFTYFLSCTFLFPKAERASYQAPHEKRGRSNVGFSPDQEDTILRLERNLAGEARGPRYRQLTVAAISTAAGVQPTGRPNSRSSTRR